MICPLLATSFFPYGELMLHAFRVVRSYAWRMEESSKATFRLGLGGGIDAELVVEHDVSQRYHFPRPKRSEGSGTCIWE